MNVETKTIGSMLEQIEALRTEAAQAGDTKLVRDCDAAVEGRLTARGCRAAVRRCQAAIRAQEAQC
jgi:hypothetical protein